LLTSWPGLDILAELADAGDGLGGLSCLAEPQAEAEAA